MMTYGEIIDLLTAAAVYDNRQAPEEGDDDYTTAVWLKSAELGNWTFPEALDALYAHFAESTAYLMPAHITERIRTERRYRAVQPVLEPGQAPPSTNERAREFIAAIGAGLNATADAKTGATPRQSWETNTHIQCPWCRAQIGYRCTNHRGKPLTKAPCHPARAEEARKLSAESG